MLERQVVTIQRIAILEAALPSHVAKELAGEVFATDDVAGDELLKSLDAKGLHEESLPGDEDAEVSQVVQETKEALATGVERATQTEGEVCNLMQVAELVSMSLDSALKRCKAQMEELEAKYVEKSDSENRAADAKITLLEMQLDAARIEEQSVKKVTTKGKVTFGSDYVHEYEQNEEIDRASVLTIQRCTRGELPGG